MTAKTPIRTVFNESGTATGLAEFQTGEFIAVEHGGTGAVTHTANAILLGNTTSAIQSSSLQISGSTLSSSDSSLITINDGLSITGALNVTGTITGTVSGNITGDITGNADTATALETARTIAGQSFDGTGDITIASTDLSDTASIVLLNSSQTLTNKTLTSPTINGATITGDVEFDSGTLSIDSTNNKVGINAPSSLTRMFEIGGDGTNAGSFAVKAASGSEWFRVVGGEVVFNQEGGLTKVATATDMGARINVGQLSDTRAALAVAGGYANNIIEVNSTNADSGGDVMVIDENGNVGIGTTTPSTILDVSGATTLGGNLTVSGNTTITGDLTVNGTTTTVNSTTIEITNSFTFEGSTADGFETVLGVIDPTADRTINLPNVSGTLPVLAAASTTQITATPEELNYVDGVTSSIQTQIDTKASTAFAIAQAVALG